MRARVSVSQAQGCWQKEIPHPTRPCAMNSPGCKRIACTGDYKPAYTEARRQVDMTLANESECGGGW
jgi:hypothetical protein